MADDVTADSLAKRGLISEKAMPAPTRTDEDPEPVRAGQQTAQQAGSPYQIRPSGAGFQVINIRTGQVHFTGTASGASNAQASLSSRIR